MKRLVYLVLVVLLALAAAGPTWAQPVADRGNIKLKVFIHYPRRGKPLPRPGICDPTQNANVNDYGLTPWKHSGAVTYHVNYSTVPSTVADAQTAIHKSYAVWDALAGGVEFVEGSSTRVKTAKNDGVMIVAWGRVPSGAIAVTYTWYNSVTGQVVDQDILLGASLPWKYTPVPNPDGDCADLYYYDVQNILTHEVGHVFGLDDLYDSVDQDLTMYGYGDKGEVKKDTLGMGDESGIRAIYH
jgi:hypothetical protein